MIEESTHTVLLVEDEAIIGMATKKSLESIGYCVILATSSEKAIELSRENKSIELILMDIDLGDGPNGIETCKTIIERKFIPIVFVSSHTEKDIVSLTEQITSYGYIVKSSHLTVYDASIKMAFKLFNEKIKRELFNRYLEVALNNTSEPFFISDMKGDIVFFNKAYLYIQGLKETDTNLVERNFENVSKQILVFNEEGIMLDSKDWANTRGLCGLQGQGVPFIVYHRFLKVFLVNLYTYSPILGEQNEIIGSYVQIHTAQNVNLSAIIERIKQTYRLKLGLNE